MPIGWGVNQATQHAVGRRLACTRAESHDCPQQHGAPLQKSCDAERTGFIQLVYEGVYVTAVDLELRSQILQADGDHR